MIPLQPKEQEIDALKSGTLELRLTNQRIYQITNLGSINTVQIIPIHNINSYGIIWRQFSNLLILASLALIGMLILLLYPQPEFQEPFIKPLDAAFYAFVLLLISIALIFLWWKTRVIGVGVFSQSGKTLLFLPALGDGVPTSFEFLRKLNIVVNKWHQRDVDQSTNWQVAASEQNSPFSMLPLEYRRPAAIGLGLFIVLIFGLFSYKVLPPYIAKMKAERIQSVLHDIKSKEPKEVFVHTLSKNVGIDWFSAVDGEIPNYLLSGIYSTVDEGGDIIQSRTLYITASGVGEIEKAIFESQSGGFDGEGNSVDEKSSESLKNPELIGSVFFSETLKGRFVNLNIRLRNGQFYREFGMIIGDVFYVRTGSLSEDISNSEKKTTTEPQPSIETPKPSTAPLTPKENTPPFPSSNSNTQTMELGIVTGQGVRVRSSMDKSNNDNVIDKIAKGTQVEILERNGEWFKIRVNGKVGYIWYEFIQ